MKLLLLPGLALLALAPARAQMFGAHGNSPAIHHDGQGFRRGGWDGGYVYRHAPSHYGYGYSFGAYYGGPGYYGDGAFDGFWLGALAGGIIGHNSGGWWGHDAWRGAAWGAGAGLLLGSLIDANNYYSGYDYRYPRAVVTTQPQPIAVQSAPVAVAPQQVTIVNNSSSNSAPMAQANALFGR